MDPELTADEAGLRNTFNCTTCVGESFKSPSIFHRMEIDLSTADMAIPPSAGAPDT